MEILEFVKLGEVDRCISTRRITLAGRGRSEGVQAADDGDGRVGVRGDCKGYDASAGTYCRSAAARQGPDAAHDVLYE